MTKQRDHSLVVKLDGEELAMVHAIAKQRDESIARVIRKFIRDCYGASFGTMRPPKPTLKHAK